MSLVGQTVGNYKITRLLGEGGMGVVYQAEHPVIGRKVAIKLLHVSLAKEPEIVGRFFNEARAIHTIRHENIVEIMDFGQTADGQPYFIMELLAGEAMNERLTRGAMPPQEVAEIADQMCRALAAAHDKGVVHRDLKPHNVQLVTTTSGRPHVKLLDFGVAKIMNPADLSQSVKTRTGSLMGTPLYMSPEQCKGAGEIDHRTDIYSLGIMLYEMLAGRPPFVAEGVGELFALHMLQQPQPVSDFAPQTPPAMVSAVMKSLAKSPADRFASMEELREAFVGDAVPIAPAPGRTRTYRSSATAAANAAGSVSSKSGGGAGHPGSTLVSPEQTSTTLSSAPRELDDAPVPARKSRAGLAIAAVVVAAAGVGTYVVMTRTRAPKSDSAETAAVKDPAGAGAGAQGAPDPAAASKPEPSRPGKTVTIRFEAEPAGAHVFRVTDDKDLGAVPLELKLPRNGGQPEYVVRLDGYDDKSLSASLTSDQTLRVALEKTAPPAPVAEPAPAAGKPTERPSGKSESSPRAAAASHGAPHPAHHKARGPSGDDDGLATPSF